MSSQSYLTHYKQNFLLAYPVMLSQLGHVLVGVADSLMVGQLGAVPLAAASLANVIFYLLLTFGIGVSYAITPLVAAADGEGDHQKSAEVLKHGILINMTTGIILLSLVLVGAKVLHYLNQPVEVVKLAIPYLGLITFSLVPFMFFQTFRQFAEGLSRTRTAMFITIVSNILNIILNYILIFGKLGFEPLGLNGAGWATLISRIVMGLLMWAYIYFSTKFEKFKAAFNLVNYSKSLIKNMLKIGIPAGLQFIFEVGAFGFAAIMVGWFGAKALAAHQIAINLASISYMMASGLSAAATIRVGNQLGKKDIPTLRRAGFTIFTMVIVFMSTTAAIFIIGKFFLPTLYINDREVIQLASTLLVIAGFFQISDGIQVVGLGSLRGMADVKIPTLITFLAYWILGLPIGYFLGFNLEMGVKGIWYGLLIGLSVAAILLFVRFNSISKKLTLKHL